MDVWRELWVLATAVRAKPAVIEPDPENQGRVCLRWSNPKHILYVELGKNGWLHADPPTPNKVVCIGRAHSWDKKNTCEYCGFTRDEEHERWKREREGSK